MKKKATKRFSPRPETQTRPENRFGTRSFIAYAKFQCGDEVVGMSKLLRSRPKMQRKVIRLIDEGKPIPAKGKIIRAAYRDMLTAYLPTPDFIY